MSSPWSAQFTKIASTLDERGADYGSPDVNLACARELKEVVRRYVQHPVSLAHDEAMDLILTKVARVVTGRIKIDNYDDLMGYAALARQEAEKVLNTNQGRHE